MRPYLCVLEAWAPPSGALHPRRPCLAGLCCCHLMPSGLVLTEEHTRLTYYGRLLTPMAFASHLHRPMACREVWGQGRACGVLVACLILLPTALVLPTHKPPEIDVTCRHMWQRWQYIAVGAQRQWQQQGRRPWRWQQGQSPMHALRAQRCKRCSSFLHYFNSFRLLFAPQQLRALLAPPFPRLPFATETAANVMAYLSVVNAGCAWRAQPRRCGRSRSSGGLRVQATSWVRALGLSATFPVTQISYTIAP